MLGQSPSPKARPKRTENGRRRTDLKPYQSPSQKRDPEPDHRNPKPSYAPFCRNATVAIYERLLQEAVTGGGVNRERKGLIRAMAAEGSGRRSHSVATPVVSFRCHGPDLLL